VRRSNQHFVKSKNIVATASDDHSRLLEELVKKNRRTVDAPRAHQYLHCEYTVAPSHERTLTDVVTYAVAAKIFTETDSRVVKTWDTGDHAWVAWMNRFYVVLNQGFPTWGYICLSDWAQVKLAADEKNIMLKGYMLICRNAEGVHGKRKVGNPCSK